MMCSLQRTTRSSILKWDRGIATAHPLNTEASVLSPCRARRSGRSTSQPKPQPKWAPRRPFRQ